MKHYVKTVQILSCFELFSPNTKCFVFGLNTGKYGPEKTPYLYSFYAMQ